jgi:hypothetical protein
VEEGQGVVSADIELDRLVLMVVGTCLVTWVFTTFAHRRSLRIKAWALAIVFFLYSGTGIVSFDSASGYFGEYFVYLVAVLAGIALTSGMLVYGSQGRAERARGEQVAHEGPADTPGAAEGARWWDPRISALLALTFVVAAVGQVVVAGAVADLFRPWTVIIQANQGGDIFAGRIARSDNAIFTLLAYVKLLCTPFFYIELQRRLDTRWGRQLIVLVLVTYLQIVAAEQWGRVTLVQPFLVWALILLLRRRISGRTFSFAALGMTLLIIPSLNAIAAWRLGESADVVGGLGAQVKHFQDVELSYPIRYPLAEAMGASGEYAQSFLLWYATLPIPRVFTGTSFSVTRDFSEAVLGISYGDPGFYVVLPSWLGESLIAFGSSGFWLWALLVGAVIGAVDRFLAKSPELVSFDAFVTALLIVYLRSVSQEFIAQVVNAIWLLVLFYVLRRGAISGPDPRRSAATRPRVRVGTR